MANDWIIDVLADLRQYALRHNYIGLAEQLDDAIVVAAGELIVEADETEAPRLGALLEPAFPRRPGGDRDAAPAV